MDPEACLLKREEYEKVMGISSEVGKSDRKWASVYRKILEIQLSGTDVLPDSLELVGLETAKKLREMKSQAFKAAGKVLAKEYPDLKSKQALYKAQRGKKHKISKSTFEKRKALYRDPLASEIEPRLIRHLRVIDGRKSPDKHPTESKTLSNPNVNKSDGA
jgi:hypothetical protein